MDLDLINLSREMMAGGGPLCFNMMEPFLSRTEMKIPYMPCNSQFNNFFYQSSLRVHWNETSYYYYQIWLFMYLHFKLFFKHFINMNLSYVYHNRSSDSSILLVQLKFINLILRGYLITMHIFAVVPFGSGSFLLLILVIKM